MIEIKLDTREASTNRRLQKGLKKLAREEGYSYREIELNTGDIWIGDYIIERKTPLDLLTRNNDGGLHIFDQLKRLIKFRKMGNKIAILVEGDYKLACSKRYPLGSNNPDKVSVIYARQAALYSRMIGLVNSLMFNYSIPIIKTTNTAETILFLKNLAKRSKKTNRKTEKAMRSPPRKTMTRDEQALYTVQSHSGIGPVKSKEVMAAFSNLHNLYNITTDEEFTKLKQIIGENNAQNLYDLLWHDYGGSNDKHKN